MMKKVFEEAERRDLCDGKAKNCEPCRGMRRIRIGERVLSCCSRDHWRRAKLDFGSRKPLDDLHRASTLGAMLKIGRVVGGGGVLFSFRLLFRAEKVKAKR
jgi:hypothetical protein